MPIMNKLTASYLAGLIDGEGWLGLIPTTRINRNGVYYEPCIKIGLTNTDLIQWLKDSFGGYVYRRLLKSGKNFDTWCYNGKKLKEFLRKVQPYLKIKKRQAELLLEKIKLSEFRLRDNPGRLTEDSPELKQQKEAIYWQIRKLNGSLHAKRLSEETAISRSDSPTLQVIGEKQL